MATHTLALRPFGLRYVACLRLDEILVLQGSPLLGAAFAFRPLVAADAAPLALLAVANLCLVAHVFVVNDWANRSADLADRNKISSALAATVDRRELAGLAVCLLAAGLLLFGLLGSTTLWLAVAVAALSGLYSLPGFDWKGTPILNSVAHLAGGTLHFLLGYSIGGRIDARVVCLATFFGLTFAAGHLTHEVRDHQGDVLNAIRTNAVIFGQRRIFVASLVLFGLANGVLLALALQGTIPRVLAVLVLFYPIQVRWSFDALAGGLTYGGVRHLQTRYRALYAVVGVAMIAAFWLQ